MAAGHPAARADPGGRAERGHPDRLRPLLAPHPGTPIPARRPGRTRHSARQDLRREDLHPHPVRPKFQAALEAARQIKAHAPHCRVILTVYEMKRPGRDSAELTALADHLTAHGIVLEMLAGPLAGIHDPSGTGRVLFAFFAAMAETDRETIRESTLEGLNAASRKGNHGGRPQSSPTTCCTPCSAAARTANPSRTSDRT